MKPFLLLAASLFVVVLPEANAHEKTKPTVKIELVTTSGNRFLGWLLEVNDSLVQAYPGKWKEWKKGTTLSTASFRYEVIRSISILQTKGRTVAQPDEQQFRIDGDHKAFTRFKEAVERPRLNFMVSPRTKKPDASFLSFQLQARFMRLFHGKRLYLVVAASAEEAVDRITKILEERNGWIGTLWFDSHGKFYRRTSLFCIGNDEFTYTAMRDTSRTIPFRELARWCDTATQVGIGACYGGATYTLPAVETFPARRMNGDSLMVALSRLLGNASIYASESFVMTGPGILNINYALCGTPKRKKFKDPLFKPVWERAGDWNLYQGSTGTFEDSLSITLKQNGTIARKSHRFLSIVRNRQKLATNLKRFRNGNYNIAYLYRH